MSEEQLLTVYRFSSHNKEGLEKDTVCGCFHCLKVFHPSEIEDWWDDEDTAVCPYCGIDSVIGESSGTKVTEPLLQEMQQMFF
ncbi:cytoplasmic protein [Bacillaceae bacterium SAOS 7]|nr:cytoplasmic protein [Bacillaceae bacterium SAOS 7]